MLAIDLVLQVGAILESIKIIFSFDMFKILQDHVIVGTGSSYNISSIITLNDSNSQLNK